jgi:hypothetical protein
MRALAHKKNMNTILRKATADDFPLIRNLPFANNAINLTVNRKDTNDTWR